MAGAPSGLTASIRQKLHDGKTPDDIVQDLVDGGLTKVSAQRFVDRVLAEYDPNAPLPALSDTAAQPPADSLDQFIQTKAAETEAANAKTGRKSLWVASALMCSGVLITGVSYVMADVGERFTFMWGPIAFGFFLWGKTVIQGFTNARTFAWFSALGSVVVPAALAVILLGAAIASVPAEEEVVAETSSVSPVINPAAMAAPATSGAVMNMIVRFENTVEPTVQCEIAHQLVTAKGDDAVDAVDGLMEHYDEVPPQVQGCIRDTVSKLDPDVEFETAAR